MSDLVGQKRPGVRMYNSVSLRKRDERELSESLEIRAKKPADAFYHVLSLQVVKGIIRWSLIGQKLLKFTIYLLGEPEGSSNSCIWQ